MRDERRGGLHSSVKYKVKQRAPATSTERRSTIVSKGTSMLTTKSIRKASSASFACSSDLGNPVHRDAYACVGGKRRDWRHGAER